MDISGSCAECTASCSIGGGNRSSMHQFSGRCSVVVLLGHALDFLDGDQLLLVLQADQQIRGAGRTWIALRKLRSIQATLALVFREYGYALVRRSITARQAIRSGWPGQFAGSNFACRLRLAWGDAKQSIQHIHQADIQGIVQTQDQQ